MEGLTFGSFISAARHKSGLTLREAAKHLGITAPYLCDIEKGNRGAFDIEKMDKFAAMVGLNQSEIELMYDLAGKSRGEVSADISRYLNDNTYIYACLRTVKTLNGTQDDWNSMLEELKRRKGVENV